ncbi:MAG: phospholipase D-like domain-containing protein [Gammaproteobacteria bacterium]|nr:phospholipase D-like domain-containing protein [Gammaproteobacteria bacterium]
MKKHPLRHYQFPWRKGNRFKLLIDAEQFYAAMLDGIKNARSSLLFEIYLFESGKVADRFLKAFVDAADRGICVRLMLDDFGCRGLNKADRQRLQHEHIQMTYYNPVKLGDLRRSLFRDHRKLMIVDQQTAFLGGAGITDAFASGHHRQWRETMIQVKGPCVQDWVSLFASVWSFTGNGEFVEDALTKPREYANGDNGRATCTHALGDHEIKRSLLKRVRQAERQIWISTAYFVPSRKIRRALKIAARNGIEVRLLLPGRHTDHPAVRHAGRRFYTRLLKSGVRIFEYQPRFLHQKVILCDSWVSIGSSNIDRWNFRWNLEANQEVESDEFSGLVQAMLDQDMHDSQEILLRDWIRRAWYRRVLEWFWGWVDRLLDKTFRH